MWGWMKNPQSLVGSRPAQHKSAACFFAAHAVSHKGLVSKPRGLQIEHGMEPKIFWSAKCGRGFPNRGSLAILKIGTA